MKQEKQSEKKLLQVNHINVPEKEATFIGQEVNKDAKTVCQFDWIVKKQSSWKF